MSKFSIMPMSYKMNLTPGLVYEDSITISIPNDAEEDFYYHISVYPYAVTDEDYTIDFENPTDASQITDWVIISEPNGKVAPGETKEITFWIDVPENAPAGGQYAMIGVSSDSKVQQIDGLAVKDVYEMASVVFATVDGEIIHSGEILKNSVPGFVTDSGVVTSALVVNEGNVHDEAITTITVKNSITGETIFPKENEQNRYSDIIMPNSTRYLTRKIEQVPALGVYQISQLIDFQGDSSETTQTVIVCPVWFAVLMIVTVGAIIGTIFAKIYKRKKRRQIL